MKSINKVTKNALLRKHRVRARILGTSERPRLSVHISNLHVSAQIIDDTQHTTLASVTTVGRKDTFKSMTDKAIWVGEEIAKKAKTTKVNKVVFDRGDKLFHGRVKALADAAREKGLEF